MNFIINNNNTDVQRDNSTDVEAMMHNNLHFAGHESHPQAADHHDETAKRRVPQHHIQEGRGDQDLQQCGPDDVRVAAKHLNILKICSQRQQQ